MSGRGRRSGGGSREVNNSYSNNNQVSASGKRKTNKYDETHDHSHRSDDISRTDSYSKRARSRSNDHLDGPFMQCPELNQLLPVSYDIRRILDEDAAEAEARHKGIRESRDVFVGNVPHTATSSQVRDYFNAVFQQLGLARRGEEPVQDCRQNAKFCFVEFRNEADCARALHLTGMPYAGGAVLRIGRPVKYGGPAGSQPLGWGAVARYREADKLNPSHRLSSSSAVGSSAVGVKGSEAGSLLRSETPDPGRRVYAGGLNSPAAQAKTEAEAEAAILEDALKQRWPLDKETKPYRELFLGNLSPEVPAMDLREYLGTALRRLGLASASAGNENPIHILTNNGKYGFIETRTAADAANLLNLDGVPFFGLRLKISRPTKFAGGLGGGMGSERYFRWEELFARWQEGELKLMTAGTPSPVLVVTNVASVAQLQNTDFYLDLIDDMRLECSLYGSVQGVIVPRVRTGSTNTGSQQQQEQQHASEGAGMVFIEMTSIDYARNALLALKGRAFNGRTVDVKFYPEGRFRAMDYGYVAPDVVVTASDGPLPLHKILNPLAMNKIERSISAGIMS